MQSLKLILGVGVLVLLAGCNNLPHTRGGNAQANQRTPSATPTAVELVNYLNENARRMQSLECRKLDIDCSQRSQTIGMRGMMVCQEPRNFRMKAKVAGSDMVDMGSNDQELWYWISKAEPPYLFHCAHQDFPKAAAKMQLPFQPDWIVEALGMTERDPAAKTFQVVTKSSEFELVENTVSARGQPVKKVTVFSRGANQVQVKAHILQDAQGKEICSANVLAVQHDAASGAVFPRQIQLVWPAEQVKMKLRLDEVAVNAPISSDRSASLFTRPTLKDVPTYDLARQDNSPIRRAGGPGR